MDRRFKNLDNELNFTPSQADIDRAFQQFDEIALDNAFVEASQKQKYKYDPIYFQNFKDQEAELIEKVSFSTAAQNYTTLYHPAFWTDAETALVNEGLHYQYKSAYWEEAASLLHQADKATFFRKWLGVASLLLLLGLTGNFFIGNKQVEAESQLVNEEIIHENIVQNKTVIESGINTSQSTTADFNANSIHLQQQHEIDNDRLATDQEVTIQSQLKNNNSAVSLKMASEGSRHETNNHDSKNKAEAVDVSDQKIKSSLYNNVHDTSEFELENSVNSTRQRIGGETMALLAVKRSEINLITATAEVENPPYRTIELMQPTTINRPIIYVSGRVGIGNCINSTINYNHRAAADLGIQFNFKKANNWSISFQTGFDYQSLQNVIESKSIVNYERSGKITYMSYGYEFADVIKYQNAFLLGYQVFPKIEMKIGAGLDQYFTSKIKIHENVGDVVSISDYQWGRNDFLARTDVQLMGQLEYDLYKKLSVIASAEFGLRKLLNSTENTDAVDNIKNKSILVGIKYQLN